MHVGGEIAECFVCDGFVLVEIRIVYDREYVGSGGGKSYAKLSEVPREELLALRKDQPAEYMRLYKAEYGVDCPPLSE